MKKDASLRGGSDYTIGERMTPVLIAAVLFVSVMFGARGLSTHFAATHRHPYIFPGLVGPRERTVVRPLTAASWRKYDRIGASTLEILLPDTTHAWLALARRLAAHGGPFTITTDWHNPVTHKVVWVYPRISGAVLDADALHAI